MAQIKNNLVFLLAISFVWIALPNMVLAQDEPTEVIQNESIEVVRLYEPILAKAKKIDVNPEAVPVDSQTPVFNDYNIPNRFLTLEFEPPSLKPLALKSKRKDPLHNFWLKAGFGNKYTPLVDLAVSSTRPNDNVLGLNIKHLSSRINGDYPQDFMENDGLVFAKLFSRKTYAKLSAGYEHDRYFYYGFNKGDTLSYPDREDTRIVYQTIPLQLEFGNLTENSAQFEHNTRVNYHYFWSNSEVGEHNLALRSSLYKNTTNGFGVGTDLYADYSGYTDTIQTGFSTANIFAFNAIPNIYLKKPFGTIRVGASLIVDEDEFIPFPYLYAEGHLIQKVLTVYGGWDKKIHKNTFKNQSDRNPYLRQVQDFENTIKESRFIGVRGNLGTKFSFDIEGGQYIADKQALFVNAAFDTSRFAIVYDSTMKSFGGKASLAFLINQKTNIHFTGSYYTNETESEVEAWHIPKLTLNMGADIALTEKLNVGADVMVYGKRFARNPNGTSKSLDGIVDLNLSLDYRLLKNLYLFGDINNIINSKYQRYLHYPTYGFNALGGVILRY